MDDHYNIALYENGLLEKYIPCFNNEIAESGFTTLILWAIHVDEEGVIFYNDYPIVKNGKFNERFSHLPEVINSLKSDDSSVKRVILSIGAGADFEHIREMLTSSTGKKSILNNFKVLADTLSIDGFDFDLEEFPLEKYTDTIVQLTIELNKFVNIITYCPYCDQEFWLDCLAQVYAKNDNEQIVSWFNLQCYDGGAGNDPKDWVDNIKNYQSPLGISDPVTFVIPGFWCRDYSPEEIQNTFSDENKSDPGINGGWMWNSGEIILKHYTLKDYADAISNGIVPKIKVGKL